MVFRVVVELIVGEVHLCLCITSVTADYLLCHFGKEGSRLFDFHESLPGVFLSPPSPCYAQETQLLASPLLRLLPVVF